MSSVRSIAAAAVSGEHARHEPLSNSMSKLPKALVAILSCVIVEIANQLWRATALEANMTTNQKQR